MKEQINIVKLLQAKKILLLKKLTQTKFFKTLFSQKVTKGMPQTKFSNHIGLESSCENIYS